MNPSYLQTLLDESIITVSVRYLVVAHSGCYTYKTRLPLEKGDYVVVPVATDRPKDAIRTTRKAGKGKDSSAPVGLLVAEVMEVHDVPEIESGSSNHYKWITQKVDVEAHDAAVDMDEEFANRARHVTRTAHRKRLMAELKEQIPKEELLKLTSGVTGEALEVETESDKS